MLRLCGNGLYGRCFLFKGAHIFVFSLAPKLVNSFYNLIIKTNLLTCAINAVPDLNSYLRFVSFSFLLLLHKKII
jgi:hypothetical protein